MGIDYELCVLLLYYGSLGVLALWVGMVIGWSLGAKPHEDLPILYVIIALLAFSGVAVGFTLLPK